MRIIAGRFKGRLIAAPRGIGPGSQPRPTTDRIRESLFNMLAHGRYGRIEGRRVLDLFAGTGALGLEALSRGAARTVFVDNSAKAHMLIQQNIERLNVASQTKIYRRDVTGLGKNRGEPYDLVFLDPPYHQDLASRALLSVIAGGWLSPGAHIVAETAAEESVPWPEEVTPEDERVYGDTRIWLLAFGV